MSRTKTEQPKPYKTLLIEARRLREEAGSNAYERAKLLVGVFADSDFRADYQQYDDAKLAEELDQYVDDLALDFLQLKALYERFPSSSDWEDGRINKLYRTLIEEKANEQRRKANNDVRPVVERVTKKDVAQLRDQLQRAEVRVGENALRAETAENEVQSLRAENAALKAKIARLEGRIEELERRRQLQVA